METASSLSVQSCTLIGFGKTGRNPCGSLQFRQRWMEQRSLQKSNPLNLQQLNGAVNPKMAPLELSCLFKNNPAGDCHKKVMIFQFDFGGVFTRRV